MSVLFFVDEEPCYVVDATYVVCKYVVVHVVSGGGNVSWMCDGE